ncbi:Carcinine transporter [Portunus trituberculatus]|uniref:Carcinine transporter n=1 Tax=Portunus trituberculatus TaxID=210409 RepID=A0A5B7J0K3_PORTR|nr:Carcinine transporter [Portunus trituberculatus]
MANVSGNEFLNFFLLSIVELPSNLLGWFSAQNLGRRWTAAGAAMLAAVCAFITAFLQKISIFRDFNVRHKLWLSFPFADHPGELAFNLAILS